MSRMSKRYPSSTRRVERLQTRDRKDKHDMRRVSCELLRTDEDGALGGVQDSVTILKLVVREASKAPCVAIVNGCVHLQTSFQSFLDDEQIVSDR